MRVAHLTTGAGSDGLASGEAGSAVTEIKATFSCVRFAVALNAGSAVALASTASISAPSEPSVRRSPQARVGGRSARVVSTVLRTTLEVLGERGYAGLRIEDVAAQAGVNKTTIYRRWPTRADLVIAALTTLATPPKAVHSGRLEGDLHATFMTRDDAPIDAGRPRRRSRADCRARRSRGRARGSGHQGAPPRACPQRAGAGAPARRPAQAGRHRAAARHPHRDHSRTAARMPSPAGPQWVRRVVRARALPGATT